MPTTPSHLTTTFLALALCACGGTKDSASPTTPTGGATATGTGTGSGTGSGTGAGTGSGTGAGTGSGTGAGTGSGTGTGTGAGTGTGTGGGTTLSVCPSEPQLRVVARYLDLLNQNAGVARTHPSAAEAVGMLILPEYVAGTPSFMFLFMQCAGPSLFDEWCDGTTCWRTECVNPGASWVQHARLERSPERYGGWTYTNALMDVVWVDPSPDFALRFAVEATDPAGDDYTLDGRLDMVGNVATTDIDLPELVPGNLVSAHAVIDMGSGTVSGEARINGVAIATLQDTGQILEFVDNGLCP